MKIKGNNRTSHLQMTRVLLPDGQYYVIWRCPSVGICGELRNFDGTLIHEINGIETERLAHWRLECAAEIEEPAILPMVEPMEPWRECLWRCAVGFAVGLFWFLAWRLTR